MKRAVQLLTSGTTGSITFWLVISQTIAAGTSFFVNIIAAAALSPTERGMLAFFLQIGYFLTIAAFFGTERPFIKNFREIFPLATNRFVRIIAPGYAIPLLTLVLAIILYLLDYLLLSYASACLFLFVIGNIHLRIIRAAFIASGSWKTFIRVTSSTQLLTLLLALTLAFCRVENFVVWLASYAIALLLPTLVVSRSLVANRKGFTSSRAITRRVRVEGLHLLPASLGNTAMFRADRLLLPILANPAQLGLYIVVAAALEVAVWPVQQWADSKLNSWQSSAGKRRESVKIMLISTGVVGGLSCVLAVILWALITYIFPPEYSQSLKLIPPLILANALYGASRIQQGRAIAAGRSRAVSLAELTGMGVSVILFLILIPPMGAMGAAIGSIGGYFVCLLVGFITMKSES